MMKPRIDKKRGRDVTASSTGLEISADFEIVRESHDLCFLGPQSVYMGHLEKGITIC